MGDLTNALRWEVGNRGFGPDGLFSFIVAANQTKAILARSIFNTDQVLTPNTIDGELVLWLDYKEGREILLLDRGSGALVLVGQDPIRTKIKIAADDIAVARAVLKKVRVHFPESKPRDDEPRLPIAFWNYTDDGPQFRVRRLNVVRWEDIAPNYSGPTRSSLAYLMNGFRPDDASGRLLLWHGKPGTGKTYAIRALAWAWWKWCRFHYVTDPDALFTKASYLTDLVLADDGCEENGVWRLLVLEDSGELMGVDAKQQVGQALARLLNLSDGLLGQGTKLMVLVTTNEELGKLNPAVSRPGRCASEIEFRSLSASEADGWLTSRGLPAIGEARSLSELFSIVQGRKEKATGIQKIGFAPQRTLVSSV